MPIIKLKTTIDATMEIVFNAARNIDMHKNSMNHTNEKAIAGTTRGLIKLGETVTWQAKHFGITQKLSVIITQMDEPFSFTDEMVSGAFKRFKHKHLFTQENGKTIMEDIFDYASPLGILGKLADFLFLKKYMTNLLKTRNLFLKDELEKSN